jgi:acyl phosphate:glycerol-3-phosphate acyltransferase
VEYVYIAIAAYLIGSFPSAFLIVKILTGRDIRTLGTGNVGVMNTVRHAGLAAGMLAFIGEGAKGVGSISAARALSGTAEADVVAAIAALVGVNFSVFMGFAGGRGTTVSVFMAAVLLPYLIVVMGMLWLATHRLTHDNFLATRVNIIAMPFLVAAIVWGTGQGSYYYVTLAAMGCLVILMKHRRDTDDHYIAATEHVRVK